MESIRSTSNPLLKRVRAVLSGKERGALVLEGDRLVEEALRQGPAVEVVLVAERRADRAAELLAAGVPVRTVSDAAFDALSRLETPAGILALARGPVARGLDELPAAADALVVVAAGIQDPGNLGSLARTAEAAGAAALCSLVGGCSPWNEKALRGSMGSLLRLPVIRAPSARAAWEALAAAGFRNVVARTRGGRDPGRFDWSGRVALWATAETGTLPAELASELAAAEAVSIPMAGEVESLNVTAAAAVLLFAARRTGGER